MKKTQSFVTFLQDIFLDLGGCTFPDANETGGDDCIALYLVAPDHNGTALQHVLFVGGPQMLGSRRVPWVKMMTRLLVECVVIFLLETCFFCV